MKSFYFFFLAFFMYLFCLPAAAQDLSWKVEKVLGEAVVIRGQKEQMAVPDLILEAGDMVETHKRSRVRLIMDQHKLWIGPKTRFKIRDDVATNDKQDKLQLYYGKLRAKVHAPSAKEKQQEMEVLTPSAVSGVRGTEFFINVSPHKESVCTIEGHVHLQDLKSNTHHSVKPYAGVSIQPGTHPHLRAMDSRIIAQWKAETSLENDHPQWSPHYQQPHLKAHSFHPSFHMGLRLQSVVGHSNHLGYGSSLLPSEDNVFAQAKLIPEFHWGSEHKLFWAPEWLYAYSEETMTLDKNPAISERLLSKVRLPGELYYQGHRQNLKWTLGQQRLHWLDGSLLGDNLWSLDSRLYPAFRLQTQFYPYFLDIFHAASQTVRAFSGNEPLTMSGLHLSYLSWAHFFALHRNYDESKSGTSKVLQNHNVWDVGLFSSRHFDQWNYQFQYVLQNGKYFQDQVSKINEENYFYQVDLGGYLHPQWHVHAEVSYLEASRNFLPGMESQFLLGYSQLLQRTNLQLQRFRLRYSQTDWHLILDWYQSWTKEASGAFAKWSGDHVSIAEEWNARWVWNYEDHSQISWVLVALFTKTALSWATPNPEAGLATQIYW